MTMMTTMMRTMMLFGYYFSLLFIICTTTSILIFANSDVIIVAAADAADADINREEELNQNQHQQQNQNNQNKQTQEQKQQERRSRQSKRKSPNFVIILTDDLDYSLGGINASTLNKTRYYIGGGGDSNNSNNKGRAGGYGKTIHNWFVQTPVCCSSRAELLTGKMYHNLKAPQPQAKSATQKQQQQQGQEQQQKQPHQCMHINVDGTNSSHIFWDQYYFAQYFSHTTASTSASKSASSASTSNGESLESKSESESSESNANYNNLDYTIGLFGKHLNTQNPSNFLPKGINEMLINGGGNYLNPSFTHGIRRTSTNKNNTTDKNDQDNDNNNNVKIEEVLFNNCTKTTGYPCYSTSVIGNASLAWIRKQVVNADGNNEDGTNEGEDDDNEGANDTTDAAAAEQNKPFFALISLKAPHIQDGNGFPTAIPAPWYKDTIINEMVAPRTPNYNTTGSTVEQPKHWLIRQQTPITQIEELKIDQLYISRLKSLLSVDDLIADLITTLGPTDLNILDNTYIIFTSDNGYRLGQYQIPQCKLHPYENDLRVPFLIRGPGIYNSADNVDNVNADNVNNIDRRHQREQQQPTTTSSTETETETERSTTTTTTATASVSDSDSDTDSDDNTNAAITTTSTSEDPPIPPLGAIFSHIHLMPTLLGLATSNYSSQSILPKTMDGTNLASYIIDYNPTNINDDINGGGDGIIDDQYEDDQYDDTSAATAAAAAFTEDFVIDPTTSTTRYTTRTTTTMNDTNTNSITDTDTDNKKNTDDNENDVVSLLIEYTSLGNVIRYQHLVDTYNHSFIALRIMPKNIAIQTTQLQTQTKQSQSQTKQQSPQDRHKKRYKQRQQQTLLHDLKQQQQQSKSQQSQQSHHCYLKKKNQNQEKNLNLNLTTTLTTATATAISRRRRRQRQRSRVLYNNSTTTTSTTKTKTKTRDDIIKFKSSNRNNNNVNGIISNNIKYIEFRDSRIDYTNTKTKPLEYELYDLEKDPYELNNIYYHNNNSNNPAVNDISFEYKKKLENKIKRLLHCNGQSCRYEHSTGLD